MAGNAEFSSRRSIQYERRPAARGKTSDPHHRSFERRMRLMVLGVVLLAAVLVTYIVLVFSPIFQIRQIVVLPTVHVSSETVSELADIQSGSTLFGFDEAGVVERLETNPWISSVSLTRNLPDTLTVSVEERTTAAIVMLSNGQDAWRLSADGVWVEQVALTEVTASNGADSYELQAKKAAAAEGVVYVCDVSPTVQAELGQECTDEGVTGVLSYMGGFSSALKDQIVFASAKSKESISVTLSSGIEVSLGEPTSIALKEETVLGILNQFAGQISYINVRTPTNPTYRGLTEGQVLGQDLYGEDTVQDGESLPYQQSEETEQAAQQALADAQQLVQGTDGEQEAQDATQDETQSSDVPSDAAYNGGYYLDDGETWVNYYYDSDGNLVHGYWDADDNWIDMG